MAARRQLALATSFTLFVACNAILGNESNYTLVPPPSEGGSSGLGGEGGAATAGAAGDGSPGGEGMGGAAQGGAAGGPSNTGGEAGSGNAGATSGGEAGAGGAGGVGGAGPCVPTGKEDCFNGIDDDCNGATDCADATCADPAACVPAPTGAGAAIVTFLPLMMGNCPTGYGPLTLHRGLSASATCDGCSCTPDAPRCESGIYGHGTYPCPSYQFMGPLYNSFSDRCEPFSGDTSVHYYAVRGFTTCTASGTATPSAASWSETQSICVAQRVGAGCASGSVCVPKITTPRCAIRRGTATCAGNYPTSTGETWYTGSNDTRSCPACSCAFGSATCTGARVQVFPTTDCTGMAVDLDSGAEGDLCAVPIVAHSTRVYGTATNASCEPNTYPTGEIAPQDPRTVCCE